MSNIVHRSTARIGAMVFSAASIAAPAQNVCGPGTAFGVTSFQCTNCSTSSLPDSTHSVYTFGAEFVVLGTTADSRIRTGDVVVAVNNNPITTRAGADQFTYPAAGEHSITVRRNGSNVTVALPARPMLSCQLSALAYKRSTDFQLGARLDTMLVAAGRGSPQGGAVGGARSGGVGGGRGGRSGGGAGAIPRTGSADSVFSSAACAFVARLSANAMADTSELRAARATCASDSLRLRVTSALDPTRSSGGLRSGAPPQMNGSTFAEISVTTITLANFGLVLACRPSCTRARGTDGSAYWRFDGYPAVSIPIAANAALKDGLAAKAGLRDGDVVISVNGLSPLSTEGALLISRSDRELALNFEVSRAGKREHVTLKL